MVVSKTVYSMMKRSVENSKKKLARDQIRVKALEATLKSMKVAKR